MNESTDRKMGPRETKAGLVHKLCDPSRGGDGSCQASLVARLADALEEALYEWKALLDAYVEHRLTPPDEMSEIAIHDGKIIDRLRAVLAEVDDGTA